MTDQEDPPQRLVAFRARGHADVRATHAKTIELTADTTITGRATCVVGVAAQLPAAALASVRGRVVVTLRTAGLSERVAAEANPRYADPGRMVLRRSGHRSRETFATGADKAAADLDRRFVACLADPGAELTVEVAAVDQPSLATAEVWVRHRPVPVPPGAAGQGAGPGRASLALAAGDALPIEEGIGGPLLVRGEEGRRAAWECLERGEAVAVIGDPTTDADASLLVAEAAAAGVPVRTEDRADRGLAALLEAGIPAGRRAVLGPPPKRRQERERQLAALAELGAAAVWEGSAARLSELLTDIAAHWPAATVAVALAPGGADELRFRGRADQLVTDEAVLSTAARVTGTLAADLGAGTGAGSEAPLRPLVAALLRAGVATRTLADALAQLPGVPRRRAYRLVLDTREADRANPPE